MKTQRKLLTDEQKKAICEKHSEVWLEDGKRYCNWDCPLRANISDGIDGKMNRSCKHIIAIENSIKDYWNEEIEV